MALLGSTGSIGTQAVEVLRMHPGRFRVVALAAGGGRLDRLADQAVELDVPLVAVSDERREASLVAALAERGHRAQVVSGVQAASRAAACGADVVLNGMTGAVGLSATLAALAAGSTLALANKESLVIGGRLVTEAAAPGQIVPVDSEHSAIAQCLRSGTAAEVGRLVLTASGGPFRGRTREQLRQVNPEQALAHPTWSMGPVITTNSATLVNKGLEVIEANLLFGVPLERIEVVVHPQSMVHSWVEFVDGSCILQAGPPDMRLAISLGLSWPERLPGVVAPIDITTPATWQFEPLDDEAFPAVALARSVGRSGGTYPAVYNAANEECVADFLAGRIGFVDIVDIVAAVVGDHVGPQQVGLTEVLAADGWARERAHQLIEAGGAAQRRTV